MGEGEGKESLTCGGKKVTGRVKRGTYKGGEKKQEIPSLGGKNTCILGWRRKLAPGMERITVSFSFPFYFFYYFLAPYPPPVPNSLSFLIAISFL